jgi:pyridoxamine 5'-phosphate oxidase
MSNVAARQAHEERPLNESDLAADPISQFQTWMSEAVAAGEPRPDAMTLATVSRDGRPSARTVLLKGCDERGFVFFTNFKSRKGQELESNRHAALVFYWHQLDRQVRIEGTVQRVSDAESDQYFRLRPRDSQISAVASPQSEVVTDRAKLDLEVERIRTRFANCEVPRPPYWGGLVLWPTEIEFWQGRFGRLHDRLRYRRVDGWKIERLAP